MKITETEIKEIREQLLLSPSTASPVWSEVEALASKVTGYNSATYAETAEVARDFYERHKNNNVDAVEDLVNLFELAEKAWFDAEEMNS